MTTMTAETTLTTISCGGCGGTYAIAERYREKCHENGTSWTCPYCNTRWGYSGNGINARLRREKAQAERATASERARHDQTRAELRETESRRRAEKGAKTKLKNRIANGVCPCCSRSFKNLHRHMQSQHPDYTEQPHD